jgi:Asp-tRNA(Asn)/Glu-tRNA(Gln) amidotransferase A subunit family amidase
VVDASLSGLRVAVSSDLGMAEVDPDVRAVFESAIAGLGVDLTETHPMPVEPTALWERIALPEGYASEGPIVAAHPELVGADATAIVLEGASVSARDYLDAQHERAAYLQIWDEFFSDFDVLLTPTMPVTAFEVGRLAPATINGRPVPPSFDAWCALSLPANLAGLPAASIPIGTGDDGLPIGLQIMARRWGDATVLRAAAAIAG